MNTIKNIMTKNESSNS
jgi:hypothetical protein